ncbi:sugar kinase [Kroppenstedtia sanguinis]|uniref:Sugar kinase n=1 Tax=Kroppenstedtia sanguinis TaxID=1380684 RepID=A0ABW4CAC1_9BACL
MSEEFGVLTIGDAMITMNPTTTGPMRYVNNFERRVGGADLNFATGCARLGLKTRWISRLGKDGFGRVIYNFARGEGVDVSHVGLEEGFATGVNFKEIREDGSGKTCYYRFPTPMSVLTPESITEEMFDGIGVLHLTGVFLALDEKNVSIALRMIEIAGKKGITVSFDPNIRLKLWTIEQAREAFRQILPHVGILLTGLEEIQLISERETVEDCLAYLEPFGIRDIVIKDGARGSQLFREGKLFEGEPFHVNAIDTVGAGDGFDAGYIYGHLNGMAPEEMLRFANAVGALVTTVWGDNEGLPYLEDMNAFLGNEVVIER